MKLPLLVGRGLPILVMLLGIVRSPSPGIVPKIPCQRIFVPSDPGVPRTFVVDCRISAKFWDVGRKPQNSHPQLTCFISFILNDYLLIYSLCQIIRK